MSDVGASSIVAWIEITPRTSRLSDWRALKSKGVISVLLTRFEVTFTRDEADNLVAVQTNRANEMSWLSVRAVLSKFVNDIALSRFEKLIASLFTLKLIFAIKLLAECPKSLAKLDIHHVGGSKLFGQFIQKLTGIFGCRFLGCHKAFDSFHRRSCLVGQADGVGSKTKHFIQARKVHRSFLREIETKLKLYRRAICERKHRPGVSLNFPQATGTGAGSTAQKCPLNNFFLDLKHDDCKP